MSTIARHCVAVHGSVLGAELRGLLRSLGYCPQAISDAVDHVGAEGTAEGTETIDARDVEAVEALIVKHTKGVEYESANDWPAWVDGEIWNLTGDEEPPFDWAVEMARVNEEDLEWAAAVFGAQAALDEGLTPPDPIRPGAVGSPQHDRQAALSAKLDSLLGVRSRPQPDVTDADLALVGAVG